MILGTLVATVAAQAQLLPQGGLGGPLGSPGGLLPGAGPDLGRIDAIADRALQVPERVAGTLAEARRAAISALVRDNPGHIELDPQGFPARAGEIVVDEPGDALIARATAQGYKVIEQGEVLGVRFARLAIPSSRSLGAALADLRKLGGKEVSADQIHLPSGPVTERPDPAASGSGPLVGVIDGGVAGAAMSAGFAAGAPRANDHGTAVASLVAGSAGVRGAFPGARIASADVYGTDPAGGNATAIAKALGWMVEKHVSVVTISLVGPPNPLLGRVVAAAQARGLMIVAAVGNDGPSAPLAYPASYSGVIAVTGVDGRNRPLIEAGRASHLDYAAPGADILATNASGRAIKVRGTSFAAPLVAGTLAKVYSTLSPASRSAALARVDADARDLGPRGPDKSYGRGLVCGECRTPTNASKK